MPYSVTITGPSSLNGEITMVSAGADQLSYNEVATGSVTPVNMDLRVDGVQSAGVTFPAKYTGQNFSFSLAGSSPLEGVFASGIVNLVTPTAAPTTPVPTNNRRPKNNGGVIKKAGNVPPTTRFAVSPVVYANERQVVGSVVVDNNAADKAVTAGVFANKTQKPIAKKVTTVLGGVSNTVLRSGAARPELVKSINKLESVRTRRFTTTIRENKYNRFTNTFDPGYPVVGVDNLGTDNAANPTRSTPGQMVYKLGGKVPVTSNYKPKTN